MLVKMELNPAKAELINGFFETYLILNTQEEAKLMEEINQLDKQESEQIFKLPNSWREKGIKEGSTQARSEIALEMLKEGISLNSIAKITKLDFRVIEELKKRL
ncbi:hypothetical protein [Bacillus sp. T3]|uniref:hypothetical protein n=1 Tax=Bacillus sp. T3 TaxID=467262 RepID=UPI00298107A1|nr:hypothetical protein [Bacillus sp. T3]